MSTAKILPKSNPNSNVHPICRNSTDLEKCDIFAERLQGVSSNLKITNDLYAQMEADRRSEGT